MAKIISAQELAGLVSQLLTDPSRAGEDMAGDTFGSFMTAIAGAVCDHCGGEVTSHAAPAAGDMGSFFIGIRGNDSLPEDGGVWKDFDSEGEL